jgi:hypothetical protein
MQSDDYSDTPDRTPPRLSLRDAVSQDFITPAGRFTLLVDPASPAYVFVIIDEEWRKCVWLEDAPDRLPSKDAAKQFLTEFSRSSMFQSLVTVEQHIQEEWDSL